MALTPENIAKINELIADHPTMTIRELAKKHIQRDSRSWSTLTANMLTFLRLMGVDIPDKRTGGIMMSAAEIEEFRAWKDQKQQRLAAE